MTRAAMGRGEGVCLRLVPCAALLSWKAMAPPSASLAPPLSSPPHLPGTDADGENTIVSGAPWFTHTRTCTYKTQARHTQRGRGGRGERGDAVHTSHAVTTSTTPRCAAVVGRVVRFPVHVKGGKHTHTHKRLEASLPFPPPPSSFAHRAHRPRSSSLPLFCFSYMQQRARVRVSPCLCLCVCVSVCV